MCGHRHGQLIGSDMGNGKWPGGSHGSHMTVRARILLVNSASNLHNYAMRLAPRLDRV